jgi:hypothetical protein
LYLHRASLDAFSEQPGNQKHKDRKKDEQNENVAVIMAKLLIFNFASKFRKQTEKGVVEALVICSECPFFSPPPKEWA